MSAYMTPLLAAKAIRAAPDAWTARDVVLRYGRQEFHYGEGKGRNDAREEAARASASTPEETPRDVLALFDLVAEVVFAASEGTPEDCNAKAEALQKAIASSVSAAREEGRREGIEEAADVADYWADAQTAARIRALAEKTETKP